MKKLTGAVLALISLFVINLSAQSAAQYDIERYDITAQVDPARNSFNATATLKLSNNGNAAGRSITLRIGANAKVSATTVNGATANFTQRDDTRFTTLQVVTITPPSPVAPKATATVGVTYTFDVPESAINASISPGDIVLLPDSAWLPVVNTPFLAHGPDQAPFTLSLTIPSGEVPFSSGTLKGATFEQSLNGQPFFIAQNFAAPMKSADGRFEAYVPKGLEQESAAQVNRLFEEATKIAQFYETLFGQPLVAPVRFAFSSRGGGFISPAAIIFDERVARQELIDADTLDLLASALAKNYIGGQARVYERGWGFVLEGMPRYLSILYLGHRFGPEAEREAFHRLVRAYTPIAAAKRDLQLVAQTLASPTYYASVPVKGPLVLRIFERELGRAQLLGTMRQLVKTAPAQPAMLETWLGLLKQAGSPRIDELTRQWLETVAEIDLMVGVPQQSGGGYQAAVRNFQAGDVTAEVMVTTASGQQLREKVRLTEATRGFGTAEFKTTEKLTRIIVDPDRVIIQIDYDNDTRVLAPEPTLLPSALTLFNEAVGDHAKRDFGAAENKLRQVLALYPNNDLARAWLSRTLAAAGKAEEAVTEAKAALATQPPTLATIAWANHTLGEVAAARGQHEVARTHFDKVARAEADAISTKAARAALVAAETAGGKTPVVDDSVRQYLSQFDKAIITASADAIKPLVVGPNLRKFAARLAITRPTQWTTTILRVEPLAADRVAVDVKLDLTTQGKTESGTALYYLRRSGPGWLLDRIEFFEVK